MNAVERFRMSSDGTEITVAIFSDQPTPMLEIEITESGGNPQIGDRNAFIWLPTEVMRKFAARILALADMAEAGQQP
jgi:hypothetical protein